MDFDAIVLGTGLSESIAAAALSKAGFKVAHIDTNHYYGGDEASLTVDELAEWADLRSRVDDAPSSDYCAHQRARYTSISRSQTLPPQSRQYSISLAPSIVPSIGPHIDSLIASGVSRYGQFKLLEKVAVYDRPGFVQSVPGSKEDVFKSKVLSLVDKRRLMRFLMFAAGEFEGKKEIEGKEEMPFVRFLHDMFSLNDKASTAIAYALAFCTSAGEPTLPAMQRIRQYLRSAGRYGSSPFLVGHYGGLGETAQGFCRTSAVKGGTYILGRRVRAVKSPSTSSDDVPVDEKTSSVSAIAHPRYRVELEDFDEQLTAKVLLSSPDYISAPLHVVHTANTSSDPHIVTAVARCIAIIDRPVVFTPSDAAEADAASPEEQDSDVDADGEAAEKPLSPTYEVDTALLVLPPASLAGGSSSMAAHALITGEGSLSTPRGRYIINISVPLTTTSPATSSAEDLLRPYLDAVLSLTVPHTAPADTVPATPLFTVFYVHHPPPVPSTDQTQPPDIIIPTSHSQLVPSIADAGTKAAEAIFWKAVEKLKAAGVRRTAPKEETEKDDGAAEKDSKEGEMESDAPDDVDSFWPPLDAVEDETSDEW
ncbi:FAD/NAD-P-binding domain-containing protein [Daedaleopsis nitida]|nr:FAD/NAD-P-binding domain-containing protein [Daedaleopsis nitida]